MAAATVKLFHYAAIQERRRHVGEWSPTTVPTSIRSNKSS